MVCVVHVIGGSSMPAIRHVVLTSISTSHHKQHFDFVNSDPSYNQLQHCHGMSRNILIIGATRGLGASLATYYASLPTTSTVYATTRLPASNNNNNSTPKHAKIRWLVNIDISQPDIGDTLVTQLIPDKVSLDTVIVSAGYFGSESFDQPDWDKQVRMYTTSAVGPVFAVQALVKASLVAGGSKIILISSESGSITLRHEKEGGGNYGHHASKAALNMVGKLLSLDLKDKGVAVGLVHPGFMRTEMTASVGFDQYWDDGGGQFTSY
jgi:NAD(P)-dependent dehydrogenase (short-subunit alcohol dehydrogenase family)